MGYASSFSLQINNFESLLLRGFLPILYNLDNCFAIMSLSCLQEFDSVSPTKCPVTFGMAVSITLGLQLQVQTAVCLSSFLCSSAKANGSYDLKCSRLQQLAAGRQLSKFRLLYLVISSFFFASIKTLSTESIF